MGIAKHPSRLSLPFIDKPYPAILEFLMQRFPKVGMAVWEERILNGKVLDDAGAPITLETPF
ncbi:MAG: pseudouridine synthase, partial [Desulfuromonadales bacterium]|nr:pseudouridine synthase [Desulfuromonadales bacterium]